MCNYWACDSSIESHYDQLKRVVGSNDLIVSTSPHVTFYYMGRVDGYLRDKVIIEAEKTTSYDNLKDEYFGIPLLDNDDLQEVLNGQRKVWIVTDPRLVWLSSEEVVQTLEAGYELYSDAGVLTTYVNCLNDPCGTPQ